MFFLVVAFIIILTLCILLALQPTSLLPSTKPQPTSSRRPSLGTTETKITQHITPYQFPPLRPKSSSRMAMGLKRLDNSNWLTLDSSYLSEHTERLSLLATRKEDVVQCLPGSEEACHEVLEVVTEFLVSRFPQHYSFVYKRFSGRGKYIRNHLTGEEYLIGEAGKEPLEIAARLAMEDFNVLVRNEEGEYWLLASATLFPAGWKLRERIGFSMQKLHGPVPGWKEKLGGSVNRYFDHLSTKTAMERTNLFIQTTPHLFQDSPESPSSTLRKPESLMVRRERQTFTRLQKTNAVLFTVRTYMQPMVEMRDKEDIKALRSQILGWEEEVRVYKGWGLWGETLLGWCEGAVGGVEDAVKGLGKEGVTREAKV